MVMNNDDLSFATSANLVLQVNRSHLDRMEDFLRIHYGAGVNANANATTSGCSSNENNATQNNMSTQTADILATKRSTASKSCSLIFIHAANDKAFIEHMMDNYKFVQHGLNKIYFMTSERSIIRGDFTSIKDDGKDSLIVEGNDSCKNSHNLLRVLQSLQSDKKCDNAAATENENDSLSSIIAKVEVFPMKLQHQVVNNLTTLLDAKCIPEDELDISPANQTHTMSIIQIDNDDTSNYLVGVSQSSYTIHKPNASNDICRAYYKLSEAFERYYRCNSNNSYLGQDDNIFFPLSKLEAGTKRKNNPGINPKPKPIIAVDCGAAPGGWTKYLMEQTACDEVYAIDPGELDKSVLISSSSNNNSNGSVHHLKMTAAKAIPKIRDALAARGEDCAVALWVSDMCVHDVPKQVDTFLCAHEEGIFRADAAFVLTIKCNVGHGKERFDQLAREESERLKKAGAYGMSIIHLFSNRIGERTIIGFIK